MNITAAELAQIVGATVEGDPDVQLTGPGTIEDAEPGSITFLGNPSYESFLYTTRASAVLVPKEFQPKEAVAATLLRVDNVYMTVSRLLTYYQQSTAVVAAADVSDRAFIDESATVAKDVNIGHFTSVRARASIGSGTIIFDQVYIGEDVKIGRNCIINPGAKIYQGCQIGDNCILHANVVIGADGFGFAPDPDTGRYNKIPQVGKVVIESDVEIGAATTIDRASIGATVIRQGVKLDDQVMIAHNVEIGENTVIAANAGVAGSTKIGANCRIGGQVGISGHLTIADGTQIQAQSGVSSDILKSGQAFGGSPHMSWRKYARSSAAVKMLPDMMKDLRKRLKTLERLVQEASDS